MDDLAQRDEKLDEGTSQGRLDAPLCLGPRRWIAAVVMHVEGMTGCKINEMRIANLLGKNVKK